LNYTNGEHGAFHNLSVVEYRCDMGFNLAYDGMSGTPALATVVTGSGASIEVGRRECTPHGWIPVSLPTCSVNRCPLLALPRDAREIIYSDLDALGAGPAYSSRATYVCLPGYETRSADADIKVPSTRNCGTRAQGWLPDVAPECRPVDCGPPSGTTAHGLPPTFDWNPALTVGPTRFKAIVTHRCEPGFMFSGGAAVFYRTCGPEAQWEPAAPTCVDINECDATLNGGKHFVNCTALHGAKSRCINTVGSFVCVPLVTLEPFLPSVAPGVAASHVIFKEATRELIPSSTAGGQRIQFAVRSGAGVVAPYFTRVRYLNPDKALYEDASLLTYECRSLSVNRGSNAARASLGFDFFVVECTLDAGQGADLYLSVQYCTAGVGGIGAPDCTRWNWEWTGTQATTDLAQVGDNSGVRVSYPMHAFVPSTLHAITAAGLTQMTNDYVSNSPLGEDLAMRVDNLFFNRTALVEVTYGFGPPKDNYPHICVFDRELAGASGNGFDTVVCHSEDNVNKLGLHFRLCVARRCAYSTDQYSYPQVPTVDSVYGCASNNYLTGSTSECPTTGGNIRLSVTGTGFLEPLTVLVSGRQCGSLERANSTYFTCTLPANAGVALSITVKAGSQRVEARDKLSYAAPTIVAIAGCEAVSSTSIRECSRYGGNRIQLEGRNFGASGATIQIGGTACMNVTHDAFTPHGRLLCTTPEGTTSDRPVTLLQRYGVVSQQSILLSYVQCPPGMRSNDVTCLPCSRGEFNDIWSQTQCRPCSPGLFSGYEGATQCQACPEGTFSSQGSSECQKCPRGTFSQGRAGDCTQCPPGTFAENEGSGMCKACPLGAESTEDFTYCRCKIGSYSDASGVCVECMPGGDCSAAGTSIFNIKSLPSYTPSVIRTELEKVGRVRAALPAAKSDDEARRAARAALTKYLYDGSMVMRPLPRARIEIASIVFMDVFPGDNVSTTPTLAAARREWFATAAVASLNLHAVVDLDIYPSTSYDDTEPVASLEERVREVLRLSLERQLIGSPGNTTNGSRVALLKADRSPIYSFELCINSACAGQNQCYEGHTGNMCTICEPGYGKTSPFVCAKCNPPALRTFVLIASIIAAIVVCSILVWKQIVDGKQSMNELPAPAVPLLFKIAASGLQVMAIAARYDLRWPGFLGDVFNGAETAGGVGTAFLSLDCFVSDTPVIRPFWVTTICITFLPLVGILLPAFVFYPLYLRKRRIYRAALVAEVVEERALTAEVIRELKTYEKAQRAVALRLIKETAKAAQDGLVWEGVDDTVGIAPPAAADTLSSTPAPETAAPPASAAPAAGNVASAGALRRKRVVAYKRRQQPLAPPVPPPQLGEDTAGSSADSSSPAMTPLTQPAVPLVRRLSSHVFTSLRAESSGDAEGHRGLPELPRQLSKRTSINSRGLGSPVLSAAGASPFMTAVDVNGSPVVRNWKRGSLNLANFALDLDPVSRVRSMSVAGSASIAGPDSRRASGVFSHGDEDVWRSERGGAALGPGGGAQDSGSRSISGAAAAYPTLSRVFSAASPHVVAFETSTADVYADEQRAELERALSLPASADPAVCASRPGVSPLIVNASVDSADQTLSLTPTATTDISNTTTEDSTTRSTSVSRTSTSAEQSGEQLNTDDNGVAIDLRDFESNSRSSGRNSLIADDYLHALRDHCADGVFSEAWLAAHEFGGKRDADGARKAGVNDSMTRDAWKTLVAEYALPGGGFDDARIKRDAAGRLAHARTPYEIAIIVQSADDMENVSLALLETDDVMYDAEVLRERVVRRERTVQRARAQRQLDWYKDTYGSSTGKAMFEAAQKQRLQASKPRVTQSEMNKRVYAAEHALKHAAAEFIGYVITSINVIMFMIHPNITKQFFMVLSCKSIGGVADPGASFMLGDLSEPCHSDEHILFILLLGIPMFLFWVVGIPFFAWIILYRNRSLIQAPVAGTSAVTRARKKIFESQMAFLYRGYKPTRYYWFLVEMARKVALVAISVFFPGALYTQLLLASMLMFVSILAQIFAQPFENRIPGAVEFLSLGTSFMIFFLANFLFVDTMNDDAKVVATVLICILVIFFFAVVVAALIVLMREEASLGPLRQLLREAYVLGHDVTQVVRKWRIDQMRLPGGKLATAALRAGGGEIAAGARRARVADDHDTRASTRRGHDEVLTLAKPVVTKWEGTVAAVQDDVHAKSDVLRVVGESTTPGMVAQDSAAAKPHDVATVNLDDGDDDDTDTQAAHYRYVH